MNKSILAAIAASLLLAGCATTSQEIAPAYVSTNLYQNLTCEQLSEEAASVSSRAVIASGAQDTKANQDKAAVAVGIIVFWPALFFQNGDGAQAAEVSRLKGEMQAIEQVNRVKNCGITFAAS